MRIVFSSWSLKMTSIIDQLSDGDYVMVPVGSRRTCNPPPTDTDDDYLILCEDRNQTVKSLKELGFEPPEDIEEYVALHDCNFTSLRFGELNFIVTEDMLWFDKFLTASYFAKKYNVTNPFEWMDMISLQGKTNFFERRVGDYQKAGVKLVDDKEASKKLNFDDDDF